MRNKRPKSTPAERLKIINEKNNIRVTNYLDKKESEGYTQLTILIAEENYRLLQDIKKDNKTNLKGALNLIFENYKAGNKPNSNYPNRQLELPITSDINAIQDNPIIDAANSSPDNNTLSETDTASPETDTKPIQDSNSDIGVSMASGIDSDSKANTSDISTISAGAILNQFITDEIMEAISQLKNNSLKSKQKKIYKLRILKLKEADSSITWDIIADFLNSHGIKPVRGNIYNSNNTSTYWNENKALLEGK